MRCLQVVGGEWAFMSALAQVSDEPAASPRVWAGRDPVVAGLALAGTGALLWAVLATEASPARRTGAGLAGFVALEAATFVRYTDMVVLGCAAVAVIVAWRPGVDYRAMGAAAAGRRGARCASAP
jgi:hypothetical protein